MHTGNTIMSQTAHASDADRWRLQTWLGIRPGAKPRVYEQVFATTKINHLSYWLEVFFSAGIATFGLVQNSPAVIIGAMLISPVMGPMMATGLALAVGDPYMGIKAVLNILASVAVSIAFSGFLVWLLPFHSATSEIISRTTPNLLDLGIALLSGLAGSVVVCRGEGEGVTALPGVAIAVALMPPLCAMGFGLGSGMNLQIMGGAGLLFLTNLVAIVASAFLIFLLVGMNTAEVHKAMLAPRENEPLAQVLSRGRIARIVATGGQLPWRVLMILILLGAIAVPLRRALLQVASETSVRQIVQDEMKRFVPADGIVSRQVSVGEDGIVIRLISTQRIPDSKVAAVREDLERRTGRVVQLAVEAIASRSELAELMARFAQPPAPVIPKPTTVGELQKQLLDKVGSAIQASWPLSDAPIQDFDVVGGAAGTTVNVRYQAPADLGDVPIHMVVQSLRTKLGVPDLNLNAVRIPPPAPAKVPPKAVVKSKRK